MIAREELGAALTLRGDSEAQAAALPKLISKVQERAAQVIPDGAVVGDMGAAAADGVRGEVQRLLTSDWDMKDLSLLLRVGLFLGAGAAAPVAGLAAMPVAALLATYGAVLKVELGGRAIQEVGNRVAERARRGVADSVREYTGKQSYSFGDLTEATVRRATGNDDYRFGDITKGALGLPKDYKFGDITKGALGLPKDYKFGDITKGALGLDKDYQFGDITKGALGKAAKAVTGKEKYEFGDITKSLFKKLTGGDK